MADGLFCKLKKDPHFRIKFFLGITIIYNLSYSVFLLVFALWQRSKWFLLIAIYYALLFVVRVIMYFNAKPKKGVLTKLKTLRCCGYFLLLVNVVVSAMMFVLVNEKQYAKYHEITVITLAVYTFAALTIAIIGNVGHFKKYNQTYLGIKIISLVSASVSLVTLTNTMLATFGNDNTLLHSIIMPLLSGVVALFIISGAIFIICKSNTAIKKIKNE